MRVTVWYLWRYYRWRQEVMLRDFSLVVVVVVFPLLPACCCRCCCALAGWFGSLVWGWCPPARTSARLAANTAVTIVLLALVLVVLSETKPHTHSQEPISLVERYGDLFDHE